MFSLVLMSTSCCKEDDDLIVPQTPGQLYPEYVGNWGNDYTTVNDVENPDVPQYAFELTNTTAIRHNDNDALENVNFDKWEVKNGKLILIGYNGNNTDSQSWTIILEPNPNEMILETTYGGDVIQYHLSK